MKNPPPVPESLAKKGIKRVTDNLQPGQSVDFASRFIRIFRPEIEALVFKPVVRQPVRRTRSKKL